ncbi:MAG: hypothetical protein KKG47_15220 [Proteobacteria bacterium]|nr:hypothetical protein [Pseudomonadota bacterium]MBU1737445.1 hypothetical protein [Pseudomonadota bacterium]
MREEKRHKLILASTIAAYCLIGVEIIIMISPFALYFYSVYGPILEFFSSSPYLSWTTEFFLPHMVFMDDPLILFISYFQVLMVIGLLLFLLAAIPLYYGRFTGKGVVQISFYSKIRHPQYLFLAVSGFGLMLYWPRFMILFMYVNMLFVYYLLARNEEWRMKQEAPESYEKYLRNTPMFIPGEPGAKIYRVLFGWIRPRGLGIFAAYLLTMTLALSLAAGIREYTVEHLPISEQAGMVMLPVFPRPEKEAREVAAALAASPEVEARRAELQPNLAYIFPGDYFLTAIVTDEDRRFSDDMIERFPEVLEWHEHKFRGGLGKFFRIFYNFVSTLGSVPTNYDVERIVFVRVTDPQGESVEADNLFKIGMRREPVMIVDIDSASHEMLSVITPSGQHKWGSMPMPTF